jgi:hypothetical protein
MLAGIARIKYSSGMTRQYLTTQVVRIGAKEPDIRCIETGSRIHVLKSL